MTNKNDTTYSKKLANRVSLIMTYAGLEISGFAEFTQISESHLYAILNGTRKLTGEVADQIGAKFEFEGWKILQLDYKIPTNIRKSPLLIKFYSENSSVTEYFIEKNNSSKTSYFVEDTLIKEGFFKSPKYVWQILEACKKAKKNISSKILSQTLLYLVEKGKLTKSKQFLLRKDGSFTNKRMVYVFQESSR